MNKKQKTVLIFGTIVLLICILAGPEYVEYIGGRYKYSAKDWAIFRSALVAGAILLIIYVFKDKKDK